MKKHDCRVQLRETNLKITPARLGILGALQNSDKPMDAAGLADYLEKKDIKADRVTVFRVINVLLEKGLVKQVQFNEGKFRYEHADRADHHHFVCESCGGIQDIMECTVDRLEKDLQKRKGFLIRRHSLEYFGLCADCRGETNEKQ